jgi:hypothetical protein
MNPAPPVMMIFCFIKEEFLVIIYVSPRSYLDNIYEKFIIELSIDNTVISYSKTEGVWLVAMKHFYIELEKFSECKNLYLR